MAPIFYPNSEFNTMTLNTTIEFKKRFYEFVYEFAVSDTINALGQVVSPIFKLAHFYRLAYLYTHTYMTRAEGTTKMI